MAKILFFIAPTGFQDVEYADSKTTLQEAGHQVITASDAPEAIGKFGSHIRTDLLLNEAKEGDYEALVLIGGPGIYVYFNDSRLHALAKAFHAAGKVTAAICAAPSILANCGLLKGVQATCFPGEAQNLKTHGVVYSPQRVMVDGLLVTADGPESAKEFGLLVLKLLGEHQGHKIL